MKLRHHLIGEVSFPATVLIVVALSPHHLPFAFIFHFTATLKGPLFLRGKIYDSSSTHVGRPSYNYSSVCRVEGVTEAKGKHGRAY